MNYPDKFDNYDQNKDNLDSVAPMPDKAPNKSLLVAYLLWLFLGFLGAHRFYLGKWISGFLYAISGGFYLLGWIMDLFLLPFMVKNANLKLDKAYQESPELFVKKEEELAPWAEEKSLFSSYIQLPIRVLFFMFAPVLFVAFGVLIKQYELLAIMLVTLIVTGLLGSVKNVLERYSSLEKVPMLGDALGTLKQLYDYYFYNRPRGILFYIFYPICALVFLPFSESVRKEFKLYMKIFGVIAILLIINTAFSYSALYPPHLTIQEALVFILTSLVFVLLMLIGFMMPIITTSFSMNLSGHQKGLRFLTVLALIFSVPFGIYGYFQETRSNTPSFLSEWRLEERLEKESFRKELTEFSEMFLRYHINNLGIESDELISNELRVDDSLTQKYYRHIGAIAIDDEVKAFSIITFRDTQHHQKGIWMGVKLNLKKKPMILFMVDSSGNFYKSWKSLPESVKSRLIIKDFDGHKVENLVDYIYKPALIDEYTSKN